MNIRILLLPITLSPLNATLLSMVGIGLIGCIDYLTGTEIRLFPLYFAPLALSARYVGRTESVLLALMTTAVWLAAMYFGGREYSRDWIWVVNAVAQGGDEFAVLLPGTGESAARTVLDQVRNDLSRLSQLATCDVTASVGALAYTAPPADLETMIQAADRLMYGVKREGKNRVVVEVS